MLTGTAGTAATGVFSTSATGSGEGTTTAAGATGNGVGSGVFTSGDFTSAATSGGAITAGSVVAAGFGDSVFAVSTFGAGVREYNQLAAEPATTSAATGSAKISGDFLRRGVATASGAVTSCSAARASMVLITRTGSGFSIPGSGALIFSATSDSAGRGSSAVSVLRSAAQGSGLLTLSRLRKPQKVSTGCPPTRYTWF
ncbi:hypothetical protein SRABI106_04515 [Rahnella aquatilis]|nr:hypothetical protein SRABI106_04515 [Rahnella aquatilis]